MIEKNRVANIWSAQERLLKIYRWVAIGLGVLAIAAFCDILAMEIRDPIVVVKTETSQEYDPSTRAKTKLEKSDVEKFVKRFLVAFYVWDGFSTQQLAKEISPLSEPGLVEKVLPVQAHRYEGGLRGKRLAQAINFVNIDVLKDRVVCHLDRLLKIEGLPIVIPTEVTLSLLEGPVTRFNPVGIFVSGIQEHEGAN